MDITKINESTMNNTIDNAKSKVADDGFEKRLKSAMNANDDKALKKVCSDFESIMLNMMFKEMKATVQKSEFIPEDSGTKIFDSMLDEKLMDEASKGKGLGLGDMLYKQLSKQLKSTYKPVSEGESPSVEKK